MLKFMVSSWHGWNVISKNADRSESHSNWFHENKKNPFSIACSCEGNDKCKLIAAWFVLLFETEMMSWSGYEHEIL